MPVIVSNPIPPEVAQLIAQVILSLERAKSGVHLDEVESEQVIDNAESIQKHLRLIANPRHDRPT